MTTSIVSLNKKIQLDYELLVVDSPLTVVGAITGQSGLNVTGDEIVTGNQNVTGTITSGGNITTSGSVVSPDFFTTSFSFTPVGATNITLSGGTANLVKIKDTVLLFWRVAVVSTTNQPATFSFTMPIYTCTLGTWGTCTFFMTPGTVAFSGLCSVALGSSTVVVQAQTASAQGLSNLSGSIAIKVA